MAAQSGKGGKVVSGSDQIAHVTKWSFEGTSNNPAFASSDTDGQKTRVPGVQDSSGSLDFIFDFANIITSMLDRGSEVTLKLYKYGTSYIEMPAIVDSISYDTDINDGEPVSGTLTFSQTAAYTNAS